MGDGSGCGVCLKGSRDEVAGHGALDGHASHWFVAHLADQGDVRVVPKDLEEGQDKSHAFLGGNLGLADTVELVFDEGLRGSECSCCLRPCKAAGAPT